MSRINTRLPLLLAISFIFAVFNYELVWKYDNGSVRDIWREEGAQQILGLAPPKYNDSFGYNKDSSIMENNNDTTALLKHQNSTQTNQPSMEQMMKPIFFYRPKQKRTGVAWDGWQKSSRNRDLNSNWWRQSKMCFEVDNICHKRNNNIWFYYQAQSRDDDIFQPSMELRFESLKYDLGQSAEKRVNITVDAASKILDTTFIDSHTFQFTNGICNISSIPIHVSLQSLFNFMLGEFYVRTLLPLHRLMTSNVSTSTGTLLPQEQDIQFYVHMSHGDQTLYDGHKLLLSGMLSRENAEVKSMVDLFTYDNGASDTSECECFEKMVFCGYDVYTNDVPKKDTLSSVTPDANLNYTLWNAASTAGDLEKVGYCGKDEMTQDIYSCDEWADLRNFLASNIEKHHPTLKGDILRYRKDVLKRNGFIEDSYNGTLDEWTFVGLAQRSYRRSWLNLPGVMNKCNSLYKQKQKMVVCVEINVEKTLIPYEQLILHRSVDALIGVHGAQMTQAVLLPTHGHVLELLPWVPDGYSIRGLWVQTRHSPTPLGVIYHNTDLYHLGYSLGRESVPLCEDRELGSEQEKECLTSGKYRKEFAWESRNFNVNPEVVLKYIERFILNDDFRGCNNITGALDEKFVLYNVWCRPDEHEEKPKSFIVNPQLLLKHYYDSPPDKKRHSLSDVTKIKVTVPSPEIDIVSLTVKDDFFVLFNNSAIDSWIHYIQNVRSITFIGPERDYPLFERNLKAHNTSIYSNPKALSIPIRWVNETHWMRTYKAKHRCGYANVCQQLIKLHVFDLKTHLGIPYIGNNILVIDSDTVWSREVTFVSHNAVTYFERISENETEHYCQTSDPIRFVEAITIGRHGKEVADEEADDFNHNHTLTPYKSCRRTQYPDATGARHIVHFMLFQQDVMDHLHSLIRKAWGASSLWQAVTTCHKYDFCKGRIAEYELYFAFVSNFYSERMNVESLTPGKDWMNSAICDAKEMQCCREKNVLLKGCHDHRIKKYLADSLDEDPGDMCCDL